MQYTLPQVKAGKRCRDLGIFAAHELLKLVGPWQTSRRITQTRRHRAVHRRAKGRVVGSGLENRRELESLTTDELKRLWVEACKSWAANQVEPLLQHTGGYIGIEPQFGTPLKEVDHSP